MIFVQLYVFYVCVNRCLCFGWLTLRRLEYISHKRQCMSFKSLFVFLWLVCICLATPSILQSALNAAARLIFNLRRSDHITDALVSLHRLRVPERIQFKIAVLAYRVLHGNAPRYLGQLTSTVDVPGRRALRSAGTNCLVMPPVRLATVGSRAFPVAAAHIWNSLPSQLLRCSHLSVIWKHSYCSNPSV